MSVSGASRYMVSAALANEQGMAAVRPEVLGGGSAQSMLDAAKMNGSVKGVGLSNRARALNAQFVQQTGSQGVAMFGLSSGASLSVADMAQQIKALRSSMPKDKISPLVLAAEEAKAQEDAKKAAAALQKEAEKMVKSERGVSLKEYERRLEEAIRVLKAKQGDENKPAHTSFRRGLTIDERA